MRRTTLEQIERLFNVASKDETRPNLNTVYVERLEQTDLIQLTATDGMKLNSVTVNDDLLYAAIAIDGTFLISRFALPFIKAALKDKSRLFDNTTTVTPDSLKTWGTELPLVQRDYPRYKQVIPTKPEIHHEVSFNVDNLVALVKSMPKSRHNIVTLKMTKNCLGPIMIKFKSHAFIAYDAVLMPCKL